MILSEALFAENSKAQTLRIVHYIADNQERFDELMELFLHGDNRTMQRASWVLSYSVESYPSLIQKHLEPFVLNLQNDTHDAVKRNTLRVLQDIPLPEDLTGFVADYCFRALQDRSFPIAVRVFSITILGNICQQEPELKTELKLLLEEMLPYEGPAFISRSKRTLKQLK